MENKRNGYLGILLGSIFVLAASTYTSTLVDDAYTAFFIHGIAAAITNFISLLSLSFTAAEQWRLRERVRRRHGKLRPFQFVPFEHAVLVTWITGLIAGVYVLVLPVLTPTENIGANAFLRASTFFYACMVLDLTFIRARTPPILQHGQDKLLYGLTNWRAHFEYVWRAFTETRYKSFDIAVDESRRQRTPTSVAWTYGPLLLLPLTYLFPVAELQIMSGLMGLNILLEGQHTLLHPHCPNWLFWQPFAAVSITEFWAVRWHKGANSFLHSLGYVPAKSIFGRCFGKSVGKAAGVLSAFSLSGLWHAWSGVPLSKDENAWGVSVGLWAVFMLQGMGVLIENWVFRDEKWKLGRRQQILRVLSWIYSVETASIWLRYAMPRAKEL